VGRGLRTVIGRSNQPWPAPQVRRTYLERYAEVYVAARLDRRAKRHARRCPWPAWAEEKTVEADLYPLQQVSAEVAHIA
jgi:hypothetical protein